MRFAMGKFWGGQSREESLHNLGHLERKLLELVWEAGEMSVHDLRERIPSLAYTTLMTTADRLYKKGILCRRKEGRAFYYAAALSREEFGEEVTRHMVRTMLRSHGSMPAGIISCFVDAVAEGDADLLKQLEELVAAKRRQNQSPEEA